MCSEISDAIQKFQQQDEKEKLANDALNVMRELAVQQTNAFHFQVTYVINLPHYHSRLTEL